MSYSKDLSRRLRKKPLGLVYGKASRGMTQSPVDYALLEPKLPDFQVVVPPHPDKYPKHPGHKGSVFGGICNRTACSRSHATFYNRGTYGYYCAEDAIGINRYSGKTPLCIVVDHDLTYEEMNAHSEQMMKEMRP